MIKYKEQRYDSIRRPINSDILVQILQDTLKVYHVDLNKEDVKGILVSVLSSISYYFFQNPAVYIDFPKMVLYRHTNLKNLITLEAKGNENAQSILKYYQDGGLYSEQLKELVQNFTKCLLEYSQEREVELSAEIQSLNKLKGSMEQSSN